MLWFIFVIVLFKPAWVAEVIAEVEVRMPDARAAAQKSHHARQLKARARRIRSIRRAQFRATGCK